MKITLNNSGEKNAGKFVFAVFEGPPEKGSLLGKVNIPSLYAGQSITANFNWTLPSEGSYTLYLIVDYNKDVEEENENNNISIYSLHIKSTATQNSSEEKVNNTTPATTGSKSDLYISNSELSYTQNVYQGTSSLVSFRIRNIGKSTAFEVPVKVYVNGNLKSSSNINQLLSSSYIDTSLYLTFTDPGEYNIEIRIDPDNIIDEISKSNNYINFNIKVMQRENGSAITQNNVQTVKDIDLLVYPYYITIEEQENEFLTIKAKIKNKSNVKVDDFSVTFYEKDYNNSSNNIFLEKIYLSLAPEEIVEESINFIPTKNSGEVIVSIDEENKINETNENNNIAIKEFYRTKNQDILDSERNLILNTTPEDVNNSNLITISMKLKDINASNVYLYYKYEESNSSFFILKMNNEGNNSYLTEVDPSGRNKLFYYFELDTGVNIIKSPYDSPNILYSVNINYQKEYEDEKNSSFLDGIKKLFRLNL
jgi:subtilase family serine protease